MPSRVIWLKKLGFTNIVGVDISDKSLELAKLTGLYDSLHNCDVMKDKLPFDDDSFDALLCVGGFMPSHVNQAVFPEFRRVVKPGGIILIAMREKYIHTAPEYRRGQLDSAIVRFVEDDYFDYLYRLRYLGFIQDFAGIIFALRVK
ncbi:methyltransferase-like protein 27 [Diadema antillarum]|uniref:methyltransferase-like protein 27 n=1 Tax=Diadema antillarum TaxID=105358 RepID=UPI003A868D91